MTLLKNFKIIDLSILLITILTVAIVSYTLITPFTPHKELNYGVVDPENSFEYHSFGRIKFENRFIAWDTNPEGFIGEVDTILARKRTPIITIEPWGLSNQGEYNFENLQGFVYQNIIQNYCQIIEQRGKKAIFRIGHEMEQVGSRYPWANGDSEGFKATFKSWVNTCRKETKLVEFMWSPMGVPGLEKYYPGPEYVDMIGLSTFGNPDYEQKVLGKRYNFQDTFNERYNRVKNYGKDVYLAEFGVSGSKEYQKQWMQQAQNAILDPLKYPNLRGVVYFQFFDKVPWVEGTAAPDFRISKELYPFN